MLGSASLVIGEDGGANLHGLRGYEALPEWVEAGKEPDPKLRDVDVSKSEWDEKRVVTAGEMLDSAVKSGKAVAGQGALDKVNGSGLKEKTLDDWLAEGEEDEEEDEDEEIDEDEDVEESEEEEESTEEDSEDEDENDVDSKEHDRLVK
jgi:AP-3 complex subunit beta